MEVIQVDSISVEIIRKKIKHMNLVVSPPNGAVRVSAPRFIPIGQIEQFIQSKILWIEKNQLKMKKLPIQKTYQYETGENHLLWGKSYQLSVLNNALINQIDMDQEYIYIFAKGIPSVADKRKLLHAWYEKQLSTHAAQLFDVWIKKIGTSISRWRIRNMKTRWGSYSSRTGIVSINIELAKKTLPCLEYLIIHELAHVSIPGHGKKFKKFMDLYLPDWRERRKILNQRS